MSRFSSAGLSVAAVAGSTGSGTIGACVATIAAGAANGFKFRRLTVGVITNTIVVPTSQQILLWAYRFTAAPTGGSAAITPAQLDPNSGPANAVFKTNTTAFVGGTFAATPSFGIPINTQSSADLPWEQLEEWIVATGTANGLAFFNQLNALPAGHQYSLSAEWEE